MLNTKPPCYVMGAKSFFFFFFFWAKWGIRLCSYTTAFSLGEPWYCRNSQTAHWNWWFFSPLLDLLLFLCYLCYVWHCSLYWSGSKLFSHKQQYRLFISNSKLQVLQHDIFSTKFDIWGSTKQNFAVYFHYSVQV